MSRKEFVSALKLGVLCGVVLALLMWDRLVELATKP